MAIFLIIVSCLLWLLAIASLFKRPILGPLLSYLGLWLLSFARRPGVGGDMTYPVLPINNTILLVWACMTVVVLIATILQPDTIKSQTRGTGYMTVGALAGLAVGLMAFSFSASLSLLYASMVLGVIAGVFFGFLLFTNTPDGGAVNLRSGRFFTYLLAKGFPIAITVMLPGVVCVLALAMTTLIA